MNPNYNNHLSKEEKTNSGSYYTPDILVQTIHQWIRPYIKKGCLIADTAAGYGAFLSSIDDQQTLGIDIDEEAVDHLRKFSSTEVHSGNSLEYINRSDWGIDADQQLIIVGNPPYNDTTSKNKRAEKTETLFMHKKVIARDYGVAFLKSYCELNAEIVCVLHPLSYLIKKANFQQLKQFSSNYKLIRGSVFSSIYFPDTRGTPFPVMIGLYQRDAMGMYYEDILNTEFEILDQPGRCFCLNKIETIDGYIRKYPPKKSENPRSDIKLYFYSIRDTNSLTTSANFSEKEKFDLQITVHYNRFMHYCYLSCYKRYFGKHYLFGNVSPLIRKIDFEKNLELQIFCLIDTLRNNPKIHLFKSNEFIERVHDDILRKFSQLSLIHQKSKNYLLIKSYLENREMDHKITKEFFTTYFQDLRSSMV